MRSSLPGSICLPILRVRRRLVAHLDVRRLGDRQLDDARVGHRLPARAVEAVLGARVGDTVTRVTIAVAARSAPASRCCGGTTGDRARVVVPIDDRDAGVFEDLRRRLDLRLVHDDVAAIVARRIRARHRIGRVERRRLALPPHRVRADDEPDDARPTSAPCFMRARRLRPSRTSSTRALSGSIVSTRSKQSSAPARSSASSSSLAAAGQRVDEPLLERLLVRRRRGEVARELRGELVLREPGLLEVALERDHHLADRREAIARLRAPSRAG